MHQFDKVYYLNLESKRERWDKFSNLLEKSNNLDRVQRFSAINSIKNKWIHNDYGIGLDPVGFSNILYFSCFKGGIGCYLSHYIMWQEIVENKWENVLILEDDISRHSVNNFMGSFKKGDYNDYDLVQLSCRKKIAGTESYWINHKGAQELINNTHDASLFKNVIPGELLINFFKNSLGYNTIDNIYEDEWDWNIKDAMVAPVDKFIYYSTDPRFYLDDPSRCKIRFTQYKLLPLDRNLQKDSAIADAGDDRIYWQENKSWQENKMIEYVKSKEYQWWKNENK
jgi:GR25 family glycosyltransferase involved in LPS biosynthesis